MKSFFSRFKEHLGCDYGGRYLEVILSEVIREDISILKILFPALDENILKSKNIEIEIEEIFPSEVEVREHRRADLVVKLNGKHKALLEIKYEDEAQEEQLSDYIIYSEKNDICFTYLTQHIPSKKDLETITLKNNKKYSHMSYAALYKSLKKRGRANKPVINLFINFMEEQFMIYNKEIDVGALELLLIKGLYVKHATGFGRKVSENNIKSIPDLWSTLISNVRVLGDRLYNDFPNYFNNRFSIDFAFDPEFNLKLLKKDVDNSLTNSESHGQLERNRKTGGWFWIGSAGKIKQKNSDDFLYLYIGYSFYLDLEKKKVSKYLHASVYGKSFDLIEENEEITGKGLLDENASYLKFLQLCNESIKKVLKNNDDLQKSFIHALSALNNELTQKIK